MRHILRHIFLSILGSVKKPKSGIHILSSHYISTLLHNPEDEKIFHNFLNHLKKHCDFILIEEAVRLITNHQFDNVKPLIAFTFDDGFEESYHLIAPILETHNTNAAFFINPNLVSCDEDYYYNFSKRSKTHNKRSMSWDQISELNERGHIIGSHTMDHYNLGDNSLTHEELIYQIDNSKKQIEKQIENNCNMFAFPFGEREYLSEDALRIIEQNYKYIFSACDYKNYFSFNNRVINRRHIEPFWPMSHMNYFLATKKKI